MPSQPVNQATLNKLRYRMGQVLAYRLSTSLPDTRIADLVGLSPAGLSALMKQPEYLEMEEAAMAGRISDLDKQLAEDKEQLAKEFRYAVPTALKALVETVQQRRDLRARIAAAKEILDRDPEAQFTGSSSVFGESGSRPPELPAELVKSLAAEGNRTVTQIRTTKTTVEAHIERVAEMPPEAGLHNA